MTPKKRRLAKKKQKQRDEKLLRGEPVPVLGSQYHRPDIHKDMDIRTVLLLLSEKSPNARQILTHIIEYCYAPEDPRLPRVPFFDDSAAYSTLPPRAIRMFLDLDDMNIRGQQIVIAYNQLCHADMFKFLNMIKSRSFTMVAALNKYGYQPWNATQFGASFNRVRFRNKKKRKK